MAVGRRWQSGVPASNSFAAEPERQCLCAEQNAGNTEASSQEQAADSGGVETTEVGSRVGSEILLAGTASLDVTARFCTGRAALRHPPLFAALPRCPY
jgi:hypothetical protein